MREFPTDGLQLREQHLLLSSRSKILLYHSVRSRQDIGWNREANLLGGLQINHQLEFRWLLDRNVRGARPFKDFLNIASPSFARCCNHVVMPSSSHFRRNQLRQRLLLQLKQR